MKEPDMYYIDAVNSICSLKLTQAEYNKIKTKTMLGVTAKHLNGRQVIAQGPIGLKRIEGITARYLGKCAWELSPIKLGVTSGRWSATTGSLSQIRKK